MLLGRIVEDVVRTDGRRVLAGLIRLTGDFDAAEDALQEAYTRALAVWHRDGVPATPGAWLNTVARRIAIDRLRRNRHTALPDDVEAPAVESEQANEIEDDRLRLLFTCCHPALAPEAQCALALRTLGGLTTREIARGFVEPESTTAQRLVRAKRKIREAGIPYEVPPLSRLPERIDTVLGVLYLIFNEGYAATDDDSLLRPNLMAEAIRLARLSAELLPADAEARGLLALMLLTDARRAARTTAAGRSRAARRPGPVAVESRADRRRRADARRRAGDAASGPYQTQAAIAALHSTAATARDTDWRQIAALYQTLLRQTPTPIVELNAAVAGHVRRPVARAGRHRAGRSRRRAGALSPAAGRQGRRAAAAGTTGRSRRGVSRGAWRWSPMPPSAGSWSGGWRSAALPDLHSLFPDRFMSPMAPADNADQATHVRFAHRQTAGDGHSHPHGGRAADRIAVSGRTGRTPRRAGAPAGRAERPAGIPPVRVGVGPGVRQTVLVNRAYIAVVHTDSALEDLADDHAYQVAVQEVRAAAIRQRRRASRRAAGGAPGGPQPPERRRPRRRGLSLSRGRRWRPCRQPRARRAHHALAE